MVTKAEFGDYMCQHCYFYLNFSDPVAKYGWTLEKYVENCVKDHDKSKCQKLANGGGCHLCLYLMDMETTKPQNKQSNSEQNVARKIIFSSENDKSKLYISTDQQLVL